MGKRSKNREHREEKRQFRVSKKVKQKLVTLSKGLCPPNVYARFLIERALGIAEPHELPFFENPDGAEDESDNIISIGRRYHNLYMNRMILEANDPALLFWFDREGMYHQYLKRPDALIVGLESNIIGNKVWKRLPARNADPLMQNLRECFEKGTASPLTMPYVTDDGATFRATHNMFRIHDNLVFSICHEELPIIDDQGK